MQIARGRQSFHPYTSPSLCIKIPRLTDQTGIWGDKAPTFFMPQSSSIPRKASFGDRRFLSGVCNSQEHFKEGPSTRKPCVRGVSALAHDDHCLQQQRWLKAGAFLPEMQTASGTGAGTQSPEEESGTPFSLAVFWEEAQR